MSGDGHGEQGTFPVTALDPGALGLLQRYWAGSLGERNKPVWDENVDEIAERTGVSVSALIAQVRAGGFAEHPTWRCPTCSGPWILRTRTDLRNARDQRCTRCRQADEAAAEQRRAEAAAAQKRLRSRIADDHPRGDTSTNPAAVWALADTDIESLVSLRAWLRRIDDDGLLHPQREHTTRLFARPETEGRLWDERLVAVDPSSPTDAFDYAVDLASYRWYPARARYHVPGTGPLEARAALASAQCDEILRGPWSVRDMREATATAEAFLVNEVSGSLTHYLQVHHLPAPDEAQVKRLMPAVRTAIGLLETGQCLTLTLRAAKDAAAHRERLGTSKVSATGYGVNQFGRYVDRETESDQRLYNDKPRYGLAFAADTTELITGVLGLPIREAGAVAVAEAAVGHLGDGDRTWYLELTALSPDAAGAAAERFAAAPSYGDRVDELISHLKEVLATKLDGGTPSAEALIAVRLEIDDLRFSDRFDDYEREEAELTFMDAIRGGSEPGRADGV